MFFAFYLACTLDISDRLISINYKKKVNDCLLVVPIVPASVLLHAANENLVCYSVTEALWEQR